MKKIIILLLMVFLMIGITAYSQNPSPTPPKTSHHNQTIGKKNTKTSSDYHNITNDTAVKVDSYINPSISPQNTNNTGKNNNNDTSTNTWIMIATIVIAICGVFQFCAMILQYFAMRKQVGELQKTVNIMEQTAMSTVRAAHAAQDNADAAKRSAYSLEVVERAYIYVTIEAKKMEPIYDDHGHHGFFNFNTNIMIWNHGKTPAVINNIRGAIHIEGAPIPSVDKFKIPSGFVLGNDKWKRITVASIKIGEKERENIFANNTIVYCSGEIGYQDIFGNDHAMGFCWEHRTIRDDPGEEWFISRKYKELNYYT